MCVSKGCTHQAAEEGCRRRMHQEMLDEETFRCVHGAGHAPGGGQDACTVHRSGESVRMAGECAHGAVGTHSTNSSRLRLCVLLR